MVRKSKRKYGFLADRESAAVSAYQVGIYLRLSNKEGKEKIKNGNSDSIENQRILLMDFIKDKPDFQLVSTFIDDGKTGTNFRRSGFEQMMEEVRNGKINCIIVKDLSRFGRNYLEAGHYIEYVFSFLHIRFIAVTDGFDTLTATSSQLSYLLPLKNLMNEHYAIDISKKERSAKNILRKKGCFLGAYAMYGYEKSTDKHVIRIDPEAAVYVKMIFDLGEQGISDSAIAKYLNQKQIACPSKYKYEKGILKNEKYANTCGWYPQTVAGILTSRVYIGDMVQGTRSSREIKGKKEMVPQSEWDIVPGTHEAIISREQFERVQKIRLDRHRKYQKVTEANVTERKVEQKKIEAGDETENNNLLKGIVYCGDCKKAMVRKRVKRCRDEYRYLCEVYERNGKCSHKFLPEQDLHKLLESLIKQQMRAASDVNEWIKKRNEEISLSQLEQKLWENKEKRKALVRKKAFFYQQWKEKTIDRKEYFCQKEYCEQDVSRCEGERNELMDKLQKYQKVCASSISVAEFHLSRELIKQLIERIEVYKDCRIKVYFKFMDEWKG